MTDTVKTSTLGLEFYAQLAFEIFWIDAFEEFSESLKFHGLIAGIAFVDYGAIRDFDAGGIK
jgi:hypothetical protein